MPILLSYALKGHENELTEGKALQMRHYLLVFPIKAILQEGSKSDTD